MKLELKYLAPYLPYGLKALNTFKEKVEVLGLQKGNESVNNILWLFKHYNGDYLQGYLYECKPILRLLSDLTKEIEVNGKKFVPKYILPIELDEKLDFETYSSVDGGFQNIDSFEIYECYQKLFEWHFDIFGLIENDLAIDINTL